MSDVTDADIFGSALADEPEANQTAETIGTEAAEAPVQAAAPSRDDKGRFAPEAIEKAEEPPAVEPPVAKEPAIPPSRLREESEARRAAEQELATLRAQMRMMQQPPQPQNAQPQAAPDIFENPDAYIRQQIDPVQAEIRQMREEHSRALAEVRHGPEKVEEAYKALNAEITAGRMGREQVLQQLQTSRDPYGEIVAWHQRQSVLTEIGTDPGAYKQKAVTEYLSDPANRDAILAAINAQAASQEAAPQGGKPASVVRLPPAMSRIPAAAQSSDAFGSMSDGDIFANALR